MGLRERFALCLQVLAGERLRERLLPQAAQARVARQFVGGDGQAHAETPRVVKPHFQRYARRRRRVGLDLENEVIVLRIPVWTERPPAGARSSPGGTAEPGRAAGESTGIWHGAQPG